MTRVCLLALLLFSCKSSSNTTRVDAAADAKADGALSACLESPTELPRPPAGQLPCELLPPGF